MAYTYATMIRLCLAFNPATPGGTGSTFLARDSAPMIWCRGS